MFPEWRFEVTNWIKRGGMGAIVVLAFLAIGVFSAHHHASAQDPNPNLLINGSLESPYYGQGAPTRTVPNNWSLWLGAGAPDAFPHNDRLQVLDGEVSWNIKQGYVAFTAAGYQRVTGLKAGDALKLTGYGWVYTCNDTQTSCIIAEPPYRRSDPSAGAVLKVGIDPNGGTDPNSADVVWSAVASPYDQWAEMTVSTTAKGEAVTVYLYMSQAKGLALNNVYWDKISLVRTAEGAAAQAPVYAPFVTPQGVRPDGSIVHVVQAGDTLSSIVFAYSQYGVTIDSVVALNAGLKPNTRFLQIGQELIILPPGSVDPVTGQPVPAGAPLTQPAAPVVATPVPVAPAEASQPPASQPEAPGAVAAANYAVARASFMAFERGFMIWVEDTRQIFVLTNGQTDLAGTYAVYLDTWREGMPETDPSIQVPPGFVQPERSFGQAWRTYPGVRDGLGWGLAAAQTYTALIVRDQGLVVVNAPDTRIYRLLEGGVWEALDLFQG